MRDGTNHACEDHRTARFVASFLGLFEVWSLDWIRMVSRTELRHKIVTRKTAVLFAAEILPSGKTFIKTDRMANIENENVISCTLPVRLQQRP